MLKVLQILQAVAKHTGSIMINVTASSILSKWYGDSSKLVKAIFSLASKIVAAGRFAVIFVDEIDALLGDHGFEMETSQQNKNEFLQLWEGLVTGRGIFVIGATNQPQRLNDAVWRRFSAHFEVLRSLADTIPVVEWSVDNDDDYDDLQSEIEAQHASTRIQQREPWGTSRIVIPRQRKKSGSTTLKAQTTKDPQHTNSDMHQQQMMMMMMLNTIR
jgi:hypothetical protein